MGLLASIHGVELAADAVLRVLTATDDPMPAIKTTPNATAALVLRVLTRRCMSNPSRVPKPAAAPSRSEILRLLGRAVKH
jgi:hypothetical protein